MGYEHLAHYPRARRHEPRFEGEFFNIFNHGEGAVENTTLSSGIVSDQFENNGVNNFANLAPTVTGHRHVRIFIKFSF